MVIVFAGQCYVPLMRSEDNTMPPVIGQPWSPDISKSNEMPRISNSPRDPSMYVRACAGPMSPTDVSRMFYSFLQDQFNYK